MWIAEDSCPEYMLKAEECLRQEEERVQHYLHISTKPKLLEQVRSSRGALVGWRACPMTGALRAKGPTTGAQTGSDQRCNAASMSRRKLQCQCPSVGLSMDTGTFTKACRN